MIYTRAQLDYLVAVIDKLAVRYMPETAPKPGAIRFFLTLFLAELKTRGITVVIEQPITGAPDSGIYGA